MPSHLPNAPFLDDHLKSGLPLQKVHHLQQQYGPNEIVAKKPPTDLDFFVAQFKNPLVLVLICAGTMTVFLQDYTDALVIFLAVFINTILGFVQERRANKSMLALKKMVATHAWVIRNHKRQQVSTRTIVPGEVIELYAGDKVPADGLVCKNNHLLISEAMLTGESIPVDKHAFSLTSTHTSLAHLKSDYKHITAPHKVSMGTVVASGSGLMIATAIGMQTEIGAIATELEQHADQPTPLETRLSYLARFLTIGVICIATGIFIYGISTQRPLEEMFTISVALAVSAIPEGLVVALTTILAIGMHRILKQQALVRSMLAAETLGTVTCVCIDKTGTLTEGKLEVSEVDMVDDKLGYTTTILANDLRDPLEFARWEWAKHQARRNSAYPTPNVVQASQPRSEAIPFSSQSQYLAVRCGNQIYLSGAPEVLLAGCNLGPAKQHHILTVLTTWAHRGRRVIGMAWVPDHTIQTAQKLFEKLRSGTIPAASLTWVGLTAFRDPVRVHVKEMIARAHQAGVEVKVITGDYTQTALAVLKQLNLAVRDEQIMEGYELDKYNQKQLASQVEKTLLFARTKPSQKLRIVQALQSNGHVVGMMGDGVNDAPALAAADISMVVGNASEVAQEAADMILLDSNFRTILGAIEEGRAIFDNLRKVILYLLSDTFSEIILVLGSLLFGWPLAITAAQVLWINLVNDGLPNLALTIDPKAKDLLKRKPLPSKTQLINGEMRLLILLISVSTGLITLCVFGYVKAWLGVSLAQTMTFAILSVDSLLYAFSCRSLRDNIWVNPPWNNPWLVGSSVIGLGLTLAAIYVPFFQQLLELAPLGWNHWGWVLSVSMSIMVLIEMLKWAFNQLLRK